jgi:hypothetical protein
VDIYEIERTIRRGGSALAESLYQYWPGFSNQADMAERNTTLHVGHELIKSGFDLYAEHPFKIDKRKQYLDLLALSYKEKIQIIIEAKKGSGKRVIKSIHNDLRKINNFTLSEQEAWPSIKGHFTKKFGVIICTSWNDNFIKWWENPNNESLDENKVHLNNEALYRLICWSLNSDDCVSGTFTLHRTEQEEKWSTHGMQYLIFKLTDKIKTILPK